MQGHNYAGPYLYRAITMQGHNCTGLLGVTVISIICFKWKISKPMGLFCLIMYAAFLACQPLFGTRRRQTPRRLDRVGRVASERSRARCVQMDTGRRRLPSACSEISSVAPAGD